MATREPTTFCPHPLLRSGHLQTIFGSFRTAAALQTETKQHRVALDDGDQIVLHENRPADWRANDPVAILIHGLCGCHAATYIVRLAGELNKRRTRTFRLDMRGCGAARDLCQQILHAGRSDDLLAATKVVANLAPESPILLAGVSLGGNQMLKMLGEMADDLSKSDLLAKVAKAVAVSPPVDLTHCSSNLAKLLLRPYGNYFMRRLIKRTPPIIQQHPVWPSLKLSPFPRTMREFDNRVTAPLAGFESAEDYYTKASAAPWVSKIVTPSLILAAQDDPIVPEWVIRSAAWSSTTELEFVRCGGHLGFVGGAKHSNWFEQRLAAWLTDLPVISHQYLSYPMPVAVAG